MFDVTPDEIKDALTGGRPEWDQDDVVNFAITAVEDTSKDGHKLVVVQLTVESEKNKGKKHTEWFRYEQYDHRKKALIRLLLNFYTPEQLPTLKGNFSALLGKKLRGTASIRHVQGADGQPKKYTDFKDLKKADDTPQLSAVPETNSAIPF